MLRAGAVKHLSRSDCGCSDCRNDYLLVAFTDGILKVLRLCATLADCVSVWGAFECCFVWHIYVANVLTIDYAKESGSNMPRKRPLAGLCIEVLLTQLFFPAVWVPPQIAFIVVIAHFDRSCAV